MDADREAASRRFPARWLRVGCVHRAATQRIDARDAERTPAQRRPPIHTDDPEDTAPMATRKPASAREATTTVSQFLLQTDHPQRAGIERLRELILGLDPRIDEEIKWNAPSFKLDDHFATFKLHPPKNIQLVLHTGAKGRSGTRRFEIDDPAGLLAWPATDRCVLTLASSEALAVHEVAVLGIVRQWIAQL